MYNFRLITREDAKEFLEFLCKLDEETPYMLYEPGERRQNNHDMRGHIGSVLSRSNSCIYLALCGGEIVGYMALYGGRCKRNQHVASLSVGVLAGHQGRGIASSLWLHASVFAFAARVSIIELTVEADNPAFRVYRRWGFHSVGVRQDAILRDGVFIDEYYMQYFDFAEGRGREEHPGAKSKGGLDG